MDGVRAEWRLHRDEIKLLGGPLRTAQTMERTDRGKNAEIESTLRRTVEEMKTL
jgi:hypothetical protein